jgi:hypothetical protein
MDNVFLIRSTCFSLMLRKHVDQGKDNLLLFPDLKHVKNRGVIKCSERLNGMLKYYYRSAV